MQACTEHLGSTSRFYDDVHQLLAASGTCWTPTVSVMGGMMARFLLPDAVGESYHGEMQAFVLAGFSPLDVLEIATRRTASALGVGRSLGTLEPGKLADLVILDQNPLDDITRTRGIWRVVKAGRVFDPARLGDGQLQ